MPRVLLRHLAVAVAKSGWSCRKNECPTGRRLRVLPPKRLDRSKHVFSFRQPHGTGHLPRTVPHLRFRSWIQRRISPHLSELGLTRVWAPVQVSGNTWVTALSSRAGRRARTPVLP